MHERPSVLHQRPLQTFEAKLRRFYLHVENLPTCDCCISVHAIESEKRGKHHSDTVSFSMTRVATPPHSRQSAQVTARELWQRKLLAASTERAAASRHRNVPCIVAYQPHLHCALRLHAAMVFGTLGLPSHGFSLCAVTSSTLATSNAWNRLLLLGCLEGIDDNGGSISGSSVSGPGGG